MSGGTTGGETFVENPTSCDAHTVELAKSGVVPAEMERDLGFEVKGVSFKMVYEEGGTFTMDCALCVKRMKNEE